MNLVQCALATAVPPAMLKAYMTTLLAAETLTAALLLVAVMAMAEAVIGTEIGKP